MLEQDLLRLSLRMNSRNIKKRLKCIGEQFLILKNTYIPFDVKDSF